MQHSLSVFLILCLLLTITPGADTALVHRSSIAGGRKLYCPTILGISAGLLFHATISSLGLSVVLQQSAELYSIVKMIGAGYLIYLGVRTPLDTRKVGSQIADLKGADADSHRSGLIEFRNCLLTNILHPKVAVFYLTFLPQFLNTQENVFVQSIGLSLIHIAFSFIWLFAIGYFVVYFKKQLAKPNVRRTIDSITGLALLGFGLRLAFSKE